MLRSMPRAPARRSPCRSCSTRRASSSANWADRSTRRISGGAHRRERLHEDSRSRRAPRDRRSCARAPRCGARARGSRARADAVVRRGSGVSGARHGRKPLERFGAGRSTTRRCRAGATRRRDRALGPLRAQPGPSRAAARSGAGMKAAKTTRSAKASAAGALARRSAASQRAAVLDVVQSPGRPLDGATRAVMEARIGYDLSSVRVHTEDQAARSAEMLGAHAYTVGRHVAFGAGRYAPGTSDGRHLMAHELTHVVQQAHGPVSALPVTDGLAISDHGDPFEREARGRAALSAQHSGRAAESLRTLPPAMLNPAHLAVQRTDPPAPDPGPGKSLSSPAWGGIGGIAGIVGGGLALLGLIAAIGAWRTPRNAAATAAGISLQPNPFSFTTMDNPVQEPDDEAHHKKYDEAVRATPEPKKILELRTDEKKNVASFYLGVSADGLNILSTTMTTDAVGYIGGYNESVAAVTFWTTQANPPPSGEKSPFKKKPAKKGGEAESDGKTGADDASADEKTSDAEPSTAEVIVHFNGSNVKEGGSVSQKHPMQMFAGTLSVKGDGTITPIDCKSTNKVGATGKTGEYCWVSFDADDAPKPKPMFLDKDKLEKEKSTPRPVGDFPPLPEGLA